MKIFSPNFANDAYNVFYDDMIKFADAALAVISEYNGIISPELDAVYLDKRTLNARVRLLASDSYQIGIHIALPVIIHFYFNILLRTSSYLPHIGDSQGEEEFRQFKDSLPTRLPNEPGLDELIPAIINGSRPLDDDRAVAAVALTKISTSFCIYHEIAHIELGHVLTNTSQLGHPEFLEIAASRIPSNLELRIRRVWEFEADKVAAIMVLHDLISDKNYDDLSEQFFLDKSSVDDMLGVAMSAIHAVFHLIDNKTSQGGIVKTHPSPLVRSASIMDEMINYSIDHIRDRISSPDELKETIISALIMTHSSWSALGVADAGIVNDPQIWEDLFLEVDNLERDRLNLLKHYVDNSYVYPFVT